MLTKDKVTMYYKSCSMFQKLIKKMKDKPKHTTSSTKEYSQSWLGIRAFHEVRSTYNVAYPFQIYHYNIS